MCTPCRYPRLTVWRPPSNRTGAPAFFSPLQSPRVHGCPVHQGAHKKSLVSHGHPWSCQNVLSTAIIWIMSNRQEHCRAGSGTHGVLSVLHRDTNGRMARVFSPLQIPRVPREGLLIRYHRSSGILVMARWRRILKALLYCLIFSSVCTTVLLNSLKVRESFFPLIIICALRVSPVAPELKTISFCRIDHVPESAVSPTSFPMTLTLVPEYFPSGCKKSVIPSDGSLKSVTVVSSFSAQTGLDRSIVLMNFQVPKNSFSE
jgi:hypothetical protein